MLINKLLMSQNYNETLFDLVAVNFPNYARNFGLSNETTVA